MSPALEAIARGLHPADHEGVLASLRALENRILQSWLEDPERILAAALKVGNGDPAAFADDPKIHQRWLRDQPRPG